jgi:hypothetical protein
MYARTRETVATGDRLLHVKIQKTGIDVRITWHIRIAVNGVCSIETSDTTLKAGAKNSIPNPPAVECGPCVKSKINGRSTADAMIIESIHALRVAVLLLECAPVFDPSDHQSFGAAMQDYCRNRRFHGNDPTQAIREFRSL